MNRFDESAAREIVSFVCLLIAARGKRQKYGNGIVT
jgi:hypothetical protein